MSAKRRRGPSRFQRELDGWILSAVDSGASTFEEILLGLPGVFPLDLVHALHRLRRTRQLTALLPGEKQSSAPRAALNGVYRTPLPAPHLLDFDWRFSDEAAELTLQTALGLTAAGDSMLFLGTPTVALSANKAAVSRDLRLVEWNAPVADVVQRSTDILVTHMDALRDASRDFSAEVVVTDPPWYRDYMHSFLWTASRWCRPNGHVLVSVPPIGTRPEMREEHAALHAFCQSVGLDRIDVMEGALPYITPPFEISALLASGFDYVPPVWRRGDLWVTRRSTTRSFEQPPTPSHDAWLDLSLGVVRVKVRRLNDDHEEIDPRLVSLIDGDVCPSVSRYRPLRQAAGLWTSNNRVFGCRSPSTLATIVQSLASNTDAADIVERELGRRLSDLEARRVIRTAENLRQIAALERDELLSFRHAYGGARLAQSAS